LSLPLLGDARRQHASRQATWLQNYDLAFAGQSVIEQNLRDLSGFSRPGWRLENKPGGVLQRGQDGFFELEDW
jgi:hypothetical protein